MAISRRQFIKAGAAFAAAGVAGLGAEPDILEMDVKAAVIGSFMSPGPAERRRSGGAFSPSFNGSSGAPVFLVSGQKYELAGIVTSGYGGKSG